MKVYVRQEESRIHNDDIKWYLADESLWITKYDNYADIEKSMGNSYFTALKLWEEDENKTFALIKLLEEMQKYNDANSLAIKESLTNTLSFK